VIAVRAVLVCLAITGCLAAAPPAGAAGFAGARLSALGIGPVRFGMTPSQAGAALGAHVRVSSHAYACGFWAFPGLRSDTVQLVSLGPAERLAIAWAGPKVRTTRGITIGDSLPRLRARYPDLKREQAEDLGLHDEDLFSDRVSGGLRYTLMFSIYRRRVTFITAGRKTTVQGLGECS
jgi:hypothetical protein